MKNLSWSRTLGPYTGLYTKRCTLIQVPPPNKFFCYMFTHIWRLSRLSICQNSWQKPCLEEVPEWVYTFWVCKTVHKQLRLISTYLLFCLKVLLLPCNFPMFPLWMLGLIELVPQLPPPQLLLWKSIAAMMFCYFRLKREKKTNKKFIPLSNAIIWYKTCFILINKVIFYLVILVSHRYYQTFSLKLLTVYIKNGFSYKLPGTRMLN